ncbi:hypothetical protein NBO_366g0005 [Nosema bombycis CQ1]|uniref:Uncharacterized protein n=1 Tax=Nosema bombycis (strain CQ1 / CVCC 102059) TaxID=578461 RepID=R0KRE7_NOSB1|nr:hypothetical protein NBO_366g0005 [Nosema bombycis CQ1]|eukprot:EOB12782.1 hypothetical protein NBO_366g0005 [Nosema bombycis CQ1]
MKGCPTTIKNLNKKLKLKNTNCVGNYFYFLLKSSILLDSIFKKFLGPTSSTCADQSKNIQMTKEKELKKDNENMVEGGLLSDVKTLVIAANPNL